MANSIKPAIYVSYSHTPHTIVKPELYVSYSHTPHTIVKPELYVSASKTANQVITPELYASWTKSARQVINPAFFLSFYQSEYDIEAAVTDAERRISAEQEANVDLQLKIDHGETDIGSADARRYIIAEQSAAIDVMREITEKYQEQGAADCVFLRYLDNTSRIDINRKVHSFVETEVDIERVLTDTATFETETDIERISAVYDEAENDIDREIINAEDDHGYTDTKLNVYSEQDGIADIERSIWLFENNIADMKRVTAVLEEGECDCSFEFGITVTKHADISRQIPDYNDFQPETPEDAEDAVTTKTFLAQQQKQGLASLQIQMSENNLTDTLTMVYVGTNHQLKNAFVGNYYDYEYNVLCEQIDYDDEAVTKTLTCNVDIDFLLNQTVYINANNRTAEQHLEYVAGKVGKGTRLRIDDFTLKDNISKTDTTYQQLISNLFSWTKNLPNKQVNSFVRAGTIYAIQRGKEANEIVIDNMHITRPVIHQELVRVETIDTDALKNGLLLPAHPRVFVTGFFDEDLELNEGEQHELHRSENKYDNEANITQKTTYNEDGTRTVIYYSYLFKNGAKYLMSETTVVYDKQNVEVSRKKVEYEYQGAGQYTAVRFDDGAFTGSATGYGKESNDISDYDKRKTYEMAWHNHTGKAITDGKLSDAKRAWDRVYELFPIKADKEKYFELAEAYNELNMKTKETITLDIYDNTHIFDFDDRIKYKNNTYYLVSNDINRDPHTISKQTLTLARWF